MPKVLQYLSALGCHFGYSRQTRQLVPHPIINHEVAPPEFRKGQSVSRKLWTEDWASQFLSLSSTSAVNGFSPDRSAVIQS